MSDVLIRPTVEGQLAEPSDHDRFTHIVPSDVLTDAMVFGTPVRALCGKVWVPSRDPERFPVCRDCIAEFEKETGRPWEGRS